MSGTANLEVVAGDPTPPYEQLRRQLVALIEAGALDPGQRLPPVRQLASDLGLAAGTVARTYRELEQAGLVTTRRGGGTRVRADLVPARPAGRVGDLDVAAEALVRTARSLGAGAVEVRAALDRALAAADEPR